MPCRTDPTCSQGTSVSSESGIRSVSYKLEWNGGTGIKSGEIPLKNAEKSVPVSIALSGADIGWGAVALTVTASDIYDRVTEQKFVLNVKDLTKISVEQPVVVAAPKDLHMGGVHIEYVRYA